MKFGNFSYILFLGTEVEILFGDGIDLILGYWYTTVAYFLTLPDTDYTFLNCAFGYWFRILNCVILFTACLFHILILNCIISVYYLTLFSISPEIYYPNSQTNASPSSKIIPNMAIRTKYSFYARIKVFKNRFVILNLAYKNMAILKNFLF